MRAIAVLACAAGAFFWGGTLGLIALAWERPWMGAVVGGAAWLTWIAVAELTPVGESLLRRRLTTRTPVPEEADLLDAALEEIREYAPSLPEVRVEVMDVDLLNAYALGQDTVIVTARALRELAPWELYGVVAHEVGHLIQDRQTELRVIHRALAPYEDVSRWMRSQRSLEDRLMIAILIAPWTLVALPAALLLIFTRLTTRRREYDADGFAADVYLSAALQSALRRFDAGPWEWVGLIPIPPKHPSSKRRRERLESVVDQE